VAEWFKAPVLKTGRGSRLSWVRIPPLPPARVLTQRPPRCPPFFLESVGVTASRHGAPHSREAPSLARASYFARFHTTSSTVPIWEAGLVYRSWSAVTELMIRFWVPPFKFGIDAASMFVVRVFVASSIDHVP
jgi:hypothetical protein